MVEQAKNVYGFGISVAGPFDQAIERVKQAFQAEGFGTITEMNVQQTLRQKIGTEMDPYVVLGMCNPQLASRAITLEHEIGLMLPCNVLVHECKGQVHVIAQDPILMMQVAQNQALEPIAKDAKQRIERALQSLKS